MNDVRGWDPMVEDSRSLAYLDAEYKPRVGSTVEGLEPTVEGLEPTVEGLEPTVEDLVEEVVQMTKYCLRLAFIHNYACGV